MICALEGDHIRYLSHGLAASAAGRRAASPIRTPWPNRFARPWSTPSAARRCRSKAVTLGIGGMDVHGAQSRGLYEFGRPREVDADDLAYAVELGLGSAAGARPDAAARAAAGFHARRARRLSASRNKGVCSRLEANVHIVTASFQEHQALVAAAHLAHLAVEETVFEPMAAAYACLLPEERARGVAVVDIGLQSTDLVVYDGEASCWRRAFRCGPITSRATSPRSSRSTYEDAESLKQQYGCALLGLTADSSLIEVPSPEGRPPREARRSELNRDSGSSRRRDVPVCRAETAARRHGAESARRRRADRRRRVTARHVRHGGARFELPGGQRACAKGSAIGRRS